MPARPSKTRKPQPRSKSMLLPLEPSVVAQVSMENHIALEMLRRGPAEMRHLGCLAQATYITRYLCEAGYGAAGDGLFGELDEAIATARRVSLETGCWRIDDNTYALLGEMLTLHDLQLAGVPVGELMAASDRLRKYSQTA
jgi:hypothetical protein